MPYPDRLLHEDEQVIAELRPHWIRLVRPVTVSGVVFAGVAVGYVEWSSAPSWFGAVLGAVTIVAALYLLGKVLSWRATLFVLTSSRVVFRAGIVRRIGREIPIDRVQDVTYHQRLIERIVGAGSLLVESAGERGAEPFPDIRHPEVVQSEINRAAEISRRGPVPPAEQTGSATDRIGDGLAKLDELHRRGVLTDSEYAHKRQELLDRL